MEIKFATDKDKEAIKKIMMYCFSVPEDHVEFFVENVFNSKNCLGCYEGQQLGATVYIYSFEMLFHGHIVPMGGIANVATLPEYRHCHCASNMLIEALKIMKDRGQIFSALGPFSYSFYRKYGWEMGFHKKEYHLLMSDLKGLGKGSGSFRMLNNEDVGEMIKVYETFVQRYNGPIYRKTEHWEWLIRKYELDGYYLYGYEDESGELQGYIFYRIENNKFYIRELMYTNPKAKREMLRFVYYHSAQANEIIWQVPADDNTILFLDNPRREQKIIPGKMIRVVDAQKVLEAYPFPKEYSGSFTITIDDPWASWNNTTFMVDVKEGLVRIEDIGEEPGDIHGSIQGFSQMFLGYTGIKEAIETGKIQLNNIKLFETIQHIFKCGITFENDSY